MINQKSLQQLFTDYIYERRFTTRLGLQTLRGYEAVFSLFLLLMPEVSSVRFLTPEMLIEFFKRLETRQRVIGRNTVKSGVKTSTVKTYRYKLNSFFEWLLHKSLLAVNPLQGFKHLQPAYGDSRALTEMDIRQIYSAITLHAKDTLISRRDTAMISLLAFCGLRLGEFISLEIRDIDFAKQLLVVRGNTSKSRKIRFIPIHPTLLLHLQDYISERNKRNFKTPCLLVSVSADKGLSKHGLKHWTIRLIKKSGVRFHLHQFRHTFACRLAERDVNAVKIQKLLGHSSLNMTMTYLRSIGTENLHEDINKLSI